MEHSHALQANALSYEAHKARWPDYAKAQQMALAHRLSNLTYAESDRVLANTPKEYDEDLHISKKKYYNLIPSTTRADQDILLGFLQSLEALEADDLISKCRYEYVLNDGGIPVKKILKQVCFLDTQQRRWAKRFCADFLVELDATFNTNKLKMLLFVAVGVTNTDLSFPAAFSLAISETKVAFDEFLRFMNREIWSEGTSAPRVACVDQGKGLLSALPSQMPTTKYQLCQWHAAENVRAK